VTTNAQRLRRAHERQAGLRRPLIETASRRALDEAAVLLPPGVILENAVELAIASGSVHGDPGVGRTTRVFLHEHNAVVVVKRTLRPSSLRKAWQPVSVERLTRAYTHEGGQDEHHA